MPQDSKGESFAALFEADGGKATPRRRSFNLGEELDVARRQGIAAQHALREAFGDGPFAQARGAREQHAMPEPPRFQDRHQVRIRACLPRRQGRERAHPSVAM